ncbi:N-acetyl-D-Glu racemase DgcA [Qipengyuania sp.]|uniref:N-acetyl-D-Glu racemase DgcA n=1 Tax=Qipengyuania sp. TaxID=2004515 RepID=UPI0035C81C41
MRLSLTVTSESLPLARPFRISRGMKTVADVVVATISQDGVEGRGECVPYPRYGETIEETVATIENQRASIEAGAGRRDLLETMSPGAARNALDCALWDLEAKLTGQSVFELVGTDRPVRVETAMTVGLDTPEVMAKAARELATSPLIKVKVDATDSAAQLRAVREAAPLPRLIVDPNESWSISQVDDLQGLLLELRVDLLEQPLPADNDGALRGYVSRVPIAADEALHTLSDLAGLPDGYNVANIKLDKAGGLTAALALAEVAQARGMQLMMGCMISSSLSIAPAMTLAPRCSFVDLDGPLWLSRDREGGISGSEGYLTGPAPQFWG